MRVLVTGSSGFIGRAVTAALEARGDQVIQFDYPQADVTAGVPRRVPADAVINLAGLLGTPELFGAQDLAVQVNILGAIRVYDYAAARGIPVVQIGTGHKGQPNPYAITKACAEDLGLARAQWSGEKIAIVRAYHVYGPGQLPGPPHGPASVRKFFPAFACAALAGMPLELHGGGAQVIDPVHVADVAEVLCDAISGPYGQVTEAGTGKGITVAQVAEDIALEAGSDAGHAITPPRPGEPDDAVVTAGAPACWHPWPHLVTETVGWYRDYLRRTA